MDNFLTHRWNQRVLPVNILEEKGPFWSITTPSSTIEYRQLVILLAFFWEQKKRANKKWALWKHDYFLWLRANRKFWLFLALFLCQLWAMYTVSSVRWDTYFLVNRVKNQKLNQTTAELPFGWVFGFQLGLRQTNALINTYYMTIFKHRHLQRWRWWCLMMVMQ